jgi:hypothetical protein
MTESFQDEIITFASSIIKMKRITLLIILLASLFATQKTMAEDDSWRDNVPLLVYAPRYFGPSAFPMPELRDSAGRLYEVELRGEYHYYSGDKTRDLFARFLLPFAKNRAGLEITWIINEHYKTDVATRDERHAVDVKSPISYGGDVVFSSYYQLLKSKKWFDAMASVNLKTASGGRLCDARFTDAASYWIDGTVARNLWTSRDERSFVRLKVLGGFYCWMTNKADHRQNDAICFSAGLTGQFRHFTIASNLVGFRGYENDGDRPLIWRNNLKYEWKKNVISFRFNHGMKDFLYDTYSVGLIRQF